MHANHNQPAACFSPVDRYSGNMEMDSEKDIHHGGGTSSGERGDQILALIKDKQVVRDSERGISAGDVGNYGIGRHVRISDLVWCKVLGRPWWPGKVIGDSIVLTEGDDCFETDSYLVLCFGSKLFAWYDELSVKPFWENFPQLAKRSNTKSFQKAVVCALEEVSRRVKYTLTCKCIPKLIYMDVGHPFCAVNDGSEKDSGNDDVPEEVILSTASFVPQELIHFLQASSVSASGCSNRLVLEAAKAQISILFVWRNCTRKLPVYSSLFAEPDNDLEAANVDFILMSQSSDEEKGNLSNESDSRVRGSKGLLLEEIDDGEGSLVGSTDGDLSKKITSSDTIMPNFESQGSAALPVTAAEKSSDHLQPTFCQIGPTKESETKQLK